jgi:hypothetical protein
LKRKSVIPAKAGIHAFENNSSHVYPNPRFLGDDKRSFSKRQTATFFQNQIFPAVLLKMQIQSLQFIVFTARAVSQYGSTHKVSKILGISQPSVVRKALTLAREQH